jgi:hypothetical protein
MKDSLSDTLDQQFAQLRKAAKKAQPKRRHRFKNPLDWGWDREIVTKKTSGLITATWGPINYVVIFRHRKYPVSASEDHPQFSVALHAARRNRKAAWTGYKLAVKHGTDTTCWDRATTETLDDRLAAITAGLGHIP